MRLPATAAVALLLALSGMSCDKSPVSPDGETLHGQVTDPAGDADVESRVSPSPDLTGASVAVEEGQATFTVQFAPGRLDPATSTAQIALDTDSNTGTGQFLSDYGQGVEYLLNFLPDDGGIVRVQRYDRASDSYQTVGNLPRANVAGGWRASIPLDLLGGDDGRATFRVICSALLGNSITAGILDYMPNSSAPPGVIE